MSQDVYSDAEMICQSIEAAANVLSDLIPSHEEARLRLTCAALTGLSSNPDSTMEGDAKAAVATADLCLALLYPLPGEPRR